MKISDKSAICLTPTTLWRELQSFGTGTYYIVVDSDLNAYNRPTSIKIMRVK